MTGRLPGVSAGRCGRRVAVGGEDEVGVARVLQRDAVAAQQVEQLGQVAGFGAARQSVGGGAEDAEDGAVDAVRPGGGGHGGGGRGSGGRPDRPGRAGGPDGPGGDQAQQEDEPGGAGVGVLVGLHGEGDDVLPAVVAREEGPYQGEAFGVGAQPEAVGDGQGDAEDGGAGEQQGGDGAEAGGDAGPGEDDAHGEGEDATDGCSGGPPQEGQSDGLRSTSRPRQRL
ncbi:hypothetical protein ACFXPX_06945 [Kitasatospora sp. NPDC059146]|uniref:hypothetical protein n=1 Tax=Kitasatospora sp. NPDC059146 TaxID=3346741 RepID=UPI00369B6918